MNMIHPLTGTKSVTLKIPILSKFIDYKNKIIIKKKYLFYPLTCVCNGLGNDGYCPMKSYLYGNLYYPEPSLLFIHILHDYTKCYYCIQAMTVTFE